jgi:hypothetical protein
MKSRFGNQPLIAVMRQQRWTYPLLATQLSSATQRQLYTTARGVVAPSPLLREELPKVLGVPLTDLFTIEALSAHYHRNSALGGSASRRRTSVSS